MTENISALDVLFDSAFEYRQRARVGISILRHVKDPEQRAAAQLGLRMILKRAPEQVQARIQTALLRYLKAADEMTLTERPAVDFSDGENEMENVILEHYPDCVHERWWELHKNDARRVLFRKYDYLKMTEERFRRVHELDCPASVRAAATAAVAQMPDDKFILPPGTGAFDWEYPDED